jgi:tRNA splicing endonuclease
MRHEEKLVLLRKYYKQEGFHIGDGLKYGVDLLLYTNIPAKIHSKYAILIDNSYTFLHIMAVQRVCNSAKKILILVYFDENDEFKMVKAERFLGRNGTSHQIS